MYDTCSYKKRLDESTGSLAYHMNPLKYENCNKCRVELGLIDGPATSQIKGNLVDLENELRGQTRLLSHCPSKKFQPGQELYTKSSNCEKPQKIDTELVHLPACQMIRYKPIPLPNPIKLDTCDDVVLNSPNSCQQAPPKPVCMSFNY